MATTGSSRHRTPLPEPLSPGARVRATAEVLLSCACGQALDSYGALHCPRCGAVRAGCAT